MPLLIIGSLLMVIATGFAIPPLEKWLGDMGIATYLWKGSDSSFGLIGLVASFGIAYSLTKQYNVDGVPSESFHCLHSSLLHRLLPVKQETECRRLIWQHRDCS